jgi:hypothetical protein
MQQLLGTDAASLSPTTVVRLKDAWFKEYRTWNQRSLAGKRYVYLWADGVYFNIRLEEDRQCILVLIGATQDGTKELGQGLRRVRREVPGQVPEGCRVPDEGPRRAARVLRLPRRALAAHPHDEPDRVVVRHGAATPSQDQGVRHSQRLPRDGLQALSGRGEKVAPT